MEAQEAIKRIKIALGMEMPEQEFKEAKLADGVTIVTWEGELEGAELSHKINSIVKSPPIGNNGITKSKLIFGSVELNGTK